jgi:hypothetical protein
MYCGMSSVYSDVDGTMYHILSSPFHFNIPASDMQKK